MLATLLCLCGCVPTHKPTENLPLFAMDVQRWAVYYDKIRPAEDFSELDLVVFDGRHHPDIAPLKGQTITLAYITLGEVYPDVPEKAVLERGNHLLYKNEKWNSYAVDLAAPAWRRMVFGAIDKTLAQGFDGIMLDTVDSPLEWARQKGPIRYRQMQEAAVKLIHAIRKKYPNIKIMLNRGFQIAPAVAGDIDYLLAESILTYKDEFTGQYNQVSPKAYADAVAQLHEIVARGDQLQVLTLDYWDMDDENGVEKIYTKQRAASFSPYVTTPDLTQFTPEQIGQKSSLSGD